MKQCPLGLSWSAPLELARRKRTSSINALSEARTHGRGPWHFQDAARFSAIRRGPVGHGRPALYMSAPYCSSEKRREGVGVGSYILWHAQPGAIYLSSSTTLERRKGRGRRRTKTGAPAHTTPAVRQGKKYQQGASSSARRFVLGRVTRYCMSVSPNHSCFTAWLCRQGQRYPCSVWTKELRLEPVASVSLGHRQ